MAMASAAAATMCASAAHSCSATPGPPWSDFAAGRGTGIGSRAGGAFLVVLCKKASRQSWTNVSASAAAPSDRRRTSEFGLVRCARAGLTSGGRKLWSDWRRAAVAEQLQSETDESSTAAFPSDFISIFFEAEGSLPEASVTKLTATLEGVEGVSDVDVRASSDGTATVKLTKHMNVQATGVASGLVEVLIQGGFKLQALNLGVDEDDGNDDDFYDYDLPTTTEETEVTE